jgi:hypothetical protein
VQVSLGIGDDAGLTSVKAQIIGIDRGASPDNATDQKF